MKTRGITDKPFLKILCMYTSVTTRCVSRRSINMAKSSFSSPLLYFPVANGCSFTMLCLASGFVDLVLVLTFRGADGSSCTRSCTGGPCCGGWTPAWSACGHSTGGNALSFPLVLFFCAEQAEILACSADVRYCVRFLPLTSSVGEEKIAALCLFCTCMYAFNHFVCEHLYPVLVRCWHVQGKSDCHCLQCLVDQNWPTL